MTMRQLRQRIARDLKDTQRGPREIPSCPDGAARALAGTLSTTILGLAEEILRESTFYQNEVPVHSCVMMEKWASELNRLAVLLVCRYCGTELLADGEGGWTCPKRDHHKGEN